MKYEISGQFAKEYKKLKNKKLATAILAAIDDVHQAKSLQDIGNFRKMAGPYPNAYRIRIGTYRIGLFLEKGVLIFSAFDHRKDIYKKFP